MGLDYDVVGSLLQSRTWRYLPSEEENRQWCSAPRPNPLMDQVFGPSAVQRQLGNKSLLRYWDTFSGSQPQESN